MSKMTVAALVAKHVSELRGFTTHQQFIDWFAQHDKTVTAGAVDTLKEYGIDYHSMTLSMPKLKERGWTEAMVRDLLGDPDELRENPRYKSAAPMRLCDAVRVEAAEAGDEFAAREKSATRRSVASVAAADNRRKQLVEAVNTITVTVPQLSEHELARTAILHRNAVRKFHYSGAPREDFCWADPDHPSSIDDDTLDRWKVNYLRHALTNYEQELTAIAGKVGVRDAVDVIREKIYDAIADAYPWLAAECYRQYAARADARV